MSINWNPQSFISSFSREDLSSYGREEGKNKFFEQLLDLFDTDPTQKKDLEKNSAPKMPEDIGDGEVGSGEGPCLSGVLGQAKNPVELNAPFTAPLETPEEIDIFELL
ncbi:hypothetical protein A2230_02585 [candidate division WOR-1 bacterium RIFOXYA2_FULL_36_21]|uniref:Uncharacterized protein n=1 Tax=candidate division WOR-1 bacterium RIFOXYB2_FULL_36_35 TaxID=1802578 RepID=A0A1F4RZF4_UNCSA|nr:MAG: hypothetical protein A2230_02585 [candidate division WOR-1 bacterium RIFOXYA2_FULL_36_21]OGC13527.1 MAG: hypothetical protein A2290_02285 [candidate division WOR-1 bacterium RIFOXYB2_FULL_36_35]OGC16833.1 MAG: hypothetical protein A2282_02415 [candidate division WOR-1 bacterium RIFOXYA12_FULL_36_13]